MKKKGIFLSALAALISIGLASCAVPNMPTPADSASSSNGGEASSSQEAPASSESDSPSESEATFVDYVHNGSCQLDLDYDGRDFYTEGIGEVTLRTAIDGDTAHFEPVVTTTSSETIKARFFGIDTPESTGKVQEWGKPASNFTKEKLYEANEHGTIVVSSAQVGYGEPNPDSTGTRYVTLVWINPSKRHAPLNELYLLNLWIVQEGLSWVKNVSDMPQYVDVFRACQNQAEAFKLNMFSGEQDPFFNYGDYLSVSILDMKREIEKSIADSSYVNAYDNQKVRFTGTVAGFSNNTLYIQEYYPLDEDHPELGGEYAGINVFVGMNAISSKYTTINTYLEICGLAQDSATFGFQITDTQGHYPLTSDIQDNDCQVLLSAADNTEEHSIYKFNYTAEQLSANAKAGNTENLNCLTEVTTPVEIERAYASSDGSEITLYPKGCDWNIFLTVKYKSAPRGKNHIWTAEEFVGYTFLVSGVYCYHRTSSGKVTYQMVPSSSADLVCQNETLLDA